MALSSCATLLPVYQHHVSSLTPWSPTFAHSMVDCLLSFSSLTHGVTYFPGCAPTFWFPDSDGHSPSWHSAPVDRYLGKTPSWHGPGVLVLIGLVLGYLYLSTAKFIFILRMSSDVWATFFFVSLSITSILPFFSYLPFPQKSSLFQICMYPASLQTNTSASLFLEKQTSSVTHFV